MQTVLPTALRNMEPGSVVGTLAAMAGLVEGDLQQGFTRAAGVPEAAFFRAMRMARARARTGLTVICGHQGELRMGYR